MTLIQFHYSALEVRLKAPDVVGLIPKIDKKVKSKIVKRSEQNVDSELGPNTTDDIIQLLQKLDVGFEHRLAAFRNIKTF